MKEEVSMLLEPARAFLMQIGHFLPNRFCLDTGKPRCPLKVFLIGTTRRGLQTKLPTIYRGKQGIK